MTVKFVFDRTFVPDSHNYAWDSRFHFYVHKCRCKIAVAQCRRETE